jgi:hypothetical protein
MSHSSDGVLGCDVAFNFGGCFITLVEPVSSCEGRLSDNEHFEGYFLKANVYLL